MANGRPVPVIMQGPRRSRQIGANINLGDLAELTGQAERQRQAETEALLQQAILEGILPTEEQAVPVEGVTPTQRAGDVPLTPTGRQAFTLEQLTGANIPGLTSAAQQQVLTPESVERIEATRRAALTGGKAGVQALRKILTPTPTATLKPDNKVFIKRDEEGTISDSRNVNVNDPTQVAAAEDAGFRVQPRGAGVQVFTGDQAPDFDAIRRAKAAELEGKASEEQFAVITKSGRTAKGKIIALNRADKLLNNITTGKLTPITKVASQIGAALGVDIDPNLSDLEAFEALANEATLQLRNTAEGAGLPGQMSDRDVRFLQAANFGVDKTPGANRKIIQARIKLLEREQQVARLAEKFKKQNNGFFDIGAFNDVLDANGLGSGGASVFDIPANATETGQFTPDGFPIYQLPDGSTFSPMQAETRTTVVEETPRGTAAAEVTEAAPTIKLTRDASGNLVRVQ
jgi:hypothetical protein